MLTKHEIDILMHEVINVIHGLRIRQQLEPMTEDKADKVAERLAVHQDLLVKLGRMRDELAV